MSVIMAVAVVAVAMAVAVRVRIAVRPRFLRLAGIEATGAGAKVFAKIAIVDIGAGSGCALAFHMVVVASLRHSYFGFEAKHLRSVLAKRAVHLIAAVEDFRNPVGKRREHPGVVVQITRFDELDRLVPTRRHVCKAVNSVDEYSAEQKIRENDYSSEREHGDMIEAWLYKRKGNSGVGGFAPAKAQPLPEHSSNFGDIAVGIRIGGASAHDDKACFRPGDFASPVGLGLRARYPLGRRGNQPGIHPEFPSVLDIQTVLGGICVKHRRNVVFRVHGGEQQSGNRENLRASRQSKIVEAVANDGVGELQETVLHRPIRQMIGKFRREVCKFANGFAGS